MQGIDFSDDRLRPNHRSKTKRKARNQARKDKKSYIDMPNITSLTYLNPRNWIFGVRLSF